MWVCRLGLCGFCLFVFALLVCVVLSLLQIYPFFRQDLCIEAADVWVGQALLPQAALLQRKQNTVQQQDVWDLTC